MSAAPAFTPFPLEAQRVRGKIIALTGGAGAIGKACAVLLARQGAFVELADLVDATAGAQVVTECGGAERSHYSRVDISSEDEVRRWFEDIAGRHSGRLDALVNNAAAFVFGTVETVDTNDWERVLGANVRGSANCSKYATPLLRATALKNGAGTTTIINMASISGTIGQPAFVPYNTSKGAIMQLTRCMAVDLGRDGIRVNGVCPGTIETPATHKHAAKLGMSFEQLVKSEAAKICLNRIGHVDDVAYAVVFLASNECTFMTGSFLSTCLS